MHWLRCNGEPANTRTALTTLMSSSVIMPLRTRKSMCAFAQLSMSMSWPWTTNMIPTGFSGLPIGDPIDSGIGTNSVNCCQVLYSFVLTNLLFPRVATGIYILFVVGPRGMRQWNRILQSSKQKFRFTSLLMFNTPHKCGKQSCNCWGI